MMHKLSITLQLSKLYFKQTWNEIPFIIVVTCGLALLAALTLLSKGTFHADSLPATYDILEAVRGFEIGLLVILALYTSEIFWKEKSVNIHQIVDALPLPSGSKLMAQVLGMSFVHVSILTLIMITGVIVQVSTGFFELNLGLYLSTLFSEFFLNGFLVILLSVFINAIINQKLVSNASIVLVLMAINYAPAWGLEHNLFQYAKLNLGKYSDLNGYQSYKLTAFAYYTIYWTGFGVCLFQLSRLFKVRGIETNIKTRFILARKRFNKSIVLSMILGMALFISSGAIIYTNTTQINAFQTRKSQELHKVAYERTLKQFESIVTPEIVAIDLQVDLFPSTRSYDIKGSYTLVNSSQQPISEIHVMANPNPKITMNSISMSRDFEISRSFPKFKFNIYILASPLGIGDSLQMDFSMQYISTGFAQRESFSVVNEGAFLTNEHLPKLSYNSAFELESSMLRAKHGLPEKIRSREIGDPKGYELGTSYAKNIAFNAVLSTDLDQEAATSGYLVKRWSERNRNYFHYQSEAPIENQFAILSGKFKNSFDHILINGDSIQLRIGHYPSHDYNVPDMMASMKATMTYAKENLSPYQYKTLNLFEIPRYHHFAMSIPNTIPFSEQMGFMLSKSTEFNVPFYITAHEVAHQWWGDQVRGALVKGSEVIEETLSQYMAAMVSIEHFGPQSLEHIMNFEKRRYMTGRKRETQIEQPLFKAENQSYIHYGKGLINMMALKHYISEDSVNSALRNMIKDFPAKEGVYPDSKHLISAFRKVTPDSLQYLVTDLFEKIIFYENGIQGVEVKKTASGSYELSLDISSKKFEGNAQGLLEEIPINDWIEIGIYSRDNDGEDKITYRKMHRFDIQANTLSLQLKSQPTKIVIDPDHLLMDRNLGDNVWKF